MATPDPDPAFILGAPNGSRVEVGGAHLKLATQLSEAHQSVSLSADVSKSAIVIAPGDGDGFLSRVLPGKGVRAESNLGIEWSNEHSFSFLDAVVLDYDMP